MAEFYCYEGIRNGATFKVDDATKSAIESNPQDIVGKVVTLTDNEQVGYGSAGDAPFGFVDQVENENNANRDTFTVSVVFNQTGVDVPCAGSEKAGSYAACDGKGGIQASTDPTKATVWTVDTEAKTAVVYIHG